MQQNQRTVIVLPLPVPGIACGELVPVGREEPEEGVPDGEEGEGGPQEGLPGLPPQGSQQPLHSLVYSHICPNTLFS